VKKFATMKELQEYVKARWQGPDYIDGSNHWHTDTQSRVLLSATWVSPSQMKKFLGSGKNFRRFLLLGIYSELRTLRQVISDQIWERVFDIAYLVVGDDPSKYGGHKYKKFRESA